MSTLNARGFGRKLNGGLIKLIRHLYWVEFSYLGYDLYSKV